MFFCRDHLDRLTVTRAQGAPDLAVEVLSPKTAHYSCPARGAFHPLLGPKIPTPPICRCAQRQSLPEPLSNPKRITPQI